MRQLNAIMNISYRDRVTNEEILRRAEMPGIETILGERQLGWSDNVCRMDDTRMPKQLFYSQLAEGKHSQGGQRLRFKDTLKRNWKKSCVNTDDWEALTQDRKSWRSAVKEGAKAFEKERLRKRCEQREKRKRGQQRKRTRLDTRHLRDEGQRTPHS